MRIKILYFVILLVFGGFVSAQDTIRSLIISEARIDDARESYVEITNVGTETLNLSQFEIGIVAGGFPIDMYDISKWFNPGTGYWFMLPDKDLAPNKSFLIAAVYDWNPEQWLIDPAKGNRAMNKKEFWKIADIQLHFPESPDNDPTDSISPNYHVLDTWQGRDCIYLRHHVTPTDSVVIDQINGVFDEPDGTRNDQPMDVAGFTNATNAATLVRKFSVKTGNVDFASGRGTDLTNSEWIPIPFQLGSWEPFRSLFWTAGNHGDYNLDEATLTSNTVDINWIDTVLTVPWGVRRDDSLMFQFDRKPGLAWHFDYAPNHEDSAFYSLRTGDRMTIYACGNELDMAIFNIIVSPPSVDANIVVPKVIPNLISGIYSNYISTWPQTWVITDKVPGMDTIMEIPFGLRSDTLLKYIEKAPNAGWEFEWLGGLPRADLQTGDILKVSAESGAVKRYFIKTDIYQNSHNAYLASITWPDIPELYKGLIGWTGDTIPNFSSSIYDFKVTVPVDVAGIPALVAKPQDINAKVEVTKAKNLTGTQEDRTVTFKVTAQDGITVLIYEVVLEKQKTNSNIQSWIAEPFFSQVVHQDQWTNYLNEIVNPGSEPLDLSNYMIAWDFTTDPATVITMNNTTTEWANRYRKYIPGYKWQSESEWAVTPRIAVVDDNVPSTVQPGDVFVTGSIFASWGLGYPWFLSLACDIDFGNNPWGETVANENAAGAWMTSTGFLFKILNDSIKLGLKPATDPNDFQLIDIFGDGNASQWVIGGVNAEQTATWVRKPQYYQGRTGLGESFGTNEEDSEWLFYNRAYWQAKGVGWPMDIMNDGVGMGSHFMDAVTVYKSTVSSNTYKVSEGYSMNELIRGVASGTTVSDFENNIIKADPAQALAVKGASGVVASGSAITDGDTLVVVSADTKNTSKYVLEVGNLSDDAVLVSTEYTVDVTGATGTISGFDYGVNLRTIVDNVTVPAGASFEAIDGNKAYVPLLLLNYDTMLVDVQVSADFYFEVIAENGTTMITYQLLPNVMNNGAFVTSSIFAVDQAASLIDLVPEGTAVYGLMKNLIPAPGANVILVDKLGFERFIGNVASDDRVIATSADGYTSKTYYLLPSEINNPPAAGTAAPPDSTICSGTSASLTLTGYSGNIQWQQSADGFTNWLNVLDGTGGNSGSYITGLLNETTYYRAEVTEQGHPAEYSNVAKILVISLPESAGTILGESTVCQGQNSVLYGVRTIENATSYIWTLPNGATGTITTNSITVDFGLSAESGRIEVSGQNACFIGVASNLSVTVKTRPANAGNISGEIVVCKGQNSVLYGVATIANATSYNWTLPYGATGTSTTKTITVNYGSSAVSGNISIKGSNSCGAGALSTLGIIVNSIPASAGAITGLTSVTQGQDDVSYIVPSIADAVSYIWTLPGGATGTSTTNTININFSSSAVSGNIGVYGQNTCGNGADSELAVVVKPLTVYVSSNNTSAGTVSGAGQYVYNALVALQATPADGFQFVNWTENDIEISTEASYSFYATIDRAIVANFGVFNVICSPPSGAISTCQGLTETYTTNSPNSLRYEWELIPSEAGSLLPNSSSCLVTWDTIFTGTAQINVRGINGTYQNPWSSTGVEVYPFVPVSGIKGPDAACSGQADMEYFISGNAAMSYNWSVAGGGGLITSNTTGERILVSWLSAGTGQVTLIQQSNAYPQCSAPITKELYVFPSFAPQKPEIKKKDHINILICTTPNQQYQWYKDGNKIPAPEGTKQFYWADKKVGIYQVEVNYGNGCVDLSSSVTVDLTYYGLATLMSVFPNPAKEFANIELESEDIGDGRIFVFDSYGSVLKIVDINKKDILLNYDLDVGNLKPGIYIIEIEVNNIKVANRKLVIH